MKNTRLFMFAACTLFLAACGRQTVKIMTPPDASNRVLFGAEQLQTTLDKAGYQVMMQQGDTTFSDPEIKTILLTEVNDTTLKKEGFHISTTGNLTRVSGRDGSGVIYGCRELIDRVNDSDGKLNFPEELKDGPEMVLRGACVGLQKMTYLPGHGVYEYPYTPESFPWFYDKEQWIKYLDMLVANRMNSLYLWNGHPFAIGNLSCCFIQEIFHSPFIDFFTFGKILSFRLIIRPFVGRFFSIFRYVIVEG